jgi:hypothetical protein
MSKDKGDDEEKKGLDKLYSPIGNPKEESESLLSKFSRESMSHHLQTSESIERREAYLTQSSENLCNQAQDDDLLFSFDDDLNDGGAFGADVSSSSSASASSSSDFTNNSNQPERKQPQAYSLNQPAHKVDNNPSLPAPALDDVNLDLSANTFIDETTAVSQVSISQDDDGLMFAMDEYLPATSPDSSNRPSAEISLASLSLNPNNKGIKDR